MSRQKKCLKKVLVKIVKKYRKKFSTTSCLILQFGPMILVNFLDQGGFQLEFVSISRVINHMTCYNSSALIG